MRSCMSKVGKASDLTSAEDSYGCMTLAQHPHDSLCLTVFTVSSSSFWLVVVRQIHNTWARENSDMSGSTAILSTFEDGILVMAGVGDSGAT